MTSRPEFRPAWIARPHVSALSINRLTQREADAIIDSVVGTTLLPARIRRDIIQRSDGVPLFLEEITKAMMEAESLSSAQDVLATVPSPALAVPAGLHAMLMGRLDRLGSAKEVAQIGAAIGRQFSHALLAAVAGKSEEEINSALRQLIAAGLLFRQDQRPHASYIFNHTLVQEAAYGTLLREPKRALHARIATVMESKFKEVCDREPELLAYHYAEAGLMKESAGFWSKAGRRSLARSALMEAIEQLTRALAQIASLPSTPASRREAIELQVSLLTPLIHVKGHAAPETTEAAERARLLIEQTEALGEPLEDPLLLFSVLYSFWVANYSAFNGDVLCELAAQFMTLAEKQEAAVPRMIGHRLMGHSLLHTGDIGNARAHFDRALALYDPARHRALAARFSQDISVAILSYRALALWLLGHPDAALADAEQALKSAREIGEIATLLYALINTMHVRICRRDHAAIAAQSKELIALADEKGASFWKAMGRSYQGCALAATGKPVEGIQLITSGFAACRSTGATVMLPLHFSYLAKAYADLAQFDDAWGSIEEAIKAIDTTKENWWHSEVSRIAGEISLLSSGPDVTEAQGYFARALAVARGQGSVSLELRAAVSMARLWRDQGKVEDAVDLLAPIYNRFTEGFGTSDLKDAKALLDELSL